MEAGRYVLCVLCACGEVASSESNPDASEAAADAASDAGGDGAPAPGKWSPPVRIDALSTIGAVDSYPAVRSDGCELFFITNREGGAQNIWVTSRLTVDEPWRTPVYVADLDATGTSQSAPELSDDGLTMYFARGVANSGTSWDLYTAKRDALTLPWEQVAPIDGINTTVAEHSPHVSVDGKTLWFARHNGADYDIWISTRGSITATWGTPREVSRFNGMGDDTGPTATGDGLELFFESGRTGSAQIYVSTRSPGEPWSPPEAVPELAEGYRPDVTPDGRYMVLSKTGSDGSSDLYESHR